MKIMKTSLRVLTILLAGLFAISTIGCELFDDNGETKKATPIETVTPSNSYEKELSGWYSLTSITMGAEVTLKPPAVKGTLAMSAGGLMLLSVEKEGGGGVLDETIISLSSLKWSATSTHIFVKDDDIKDDNIYYELSGTDLELNFHYEGLLIRFKKTR